MMGEIGGRDGESNFGRLSAACGELVGPGVDFRYRSFWLSLVHQRSILKCKMVHGQGSNFVDLAS